MLTFGQENQISDSGELGEEISADIDEEWVLLILITMRMLPFFIEGSITCA